MEAALRYELEQAIPELQGEIYPANAPETSKKPYLVYMRTRTDRIKTLTGYENKQALGFMFNVMAAKYEEMKGLRDKTEALLLTLAGTAIGKNASIYIEDLTINNVEEVYEFNLRVNRGIIDFTIYF